MAEPIFHLSPRRLWDGQGEVFAPPGFEDEGFIHCSTESQLPEVARRLYIHERDLVSVAIDPVALGRMAPVYEDLYGVGEEFPHLYGRLPIAAVLSVTPYLQHLEEALWLENRFDREWMDRTLHPLFQEVGMSGRVYGRDETLTMPIGRLEATLPHEGYRLDLVSGGVGLARYISNDRVDGRERRAQRSSVWLRDDEGWRLRFHQGTPLS